MLTNATQGKALSVIAPVRHFVEALHAGKVSVVGYLLTVQDSCLRPVGIFMYTDVIETFC